MKRQPALALRLPRWLTGSFGRLRRDQSGATAIEFALVALPFFMLVFGVIAIGLYFFTTFSLEHALDVASRSVRTCSYRNENSGTGMTTRQFKDSVCALTPTFIDCEAHLRVRLQTVTEFSAITAGDLSESSCVDTEGELVADATNNLTKLTASASSIALITACYRYELARATPFLKLGSVSGSDHSYIQVSTAFRIEPCD